MKHFTKAPILMLFLCSFATFGQGIQIPKLDNRSNLNSLNLHLAASKLCKDFYENADLNQERQERSNYQGPNNQYYYTCHICASSIRYPFMNPLESFVDGYLNDKRLFRNKSNAFTVRALREEIKTKYGNDYANLLEETDPESMVFYQTDLISGYSFEQNELYIKMSNPRFSNLLPHTMNNGSIIFSPLLMDHGVKSDGNVVRVIGGNHLGWFKVPMTEERAQEIYSNYANHYHPNPPFSIATKLHYALRLSKEYDGKPRYYQVVLKKVEFFLPKIENLKKLAYNVVKETYHADNKIAEVIFEETIRTTDKGYLYQKIREIN